MYKRNNTSYTVYINRELVKLYDEYNSCKLKSYLKFYQYCPVRWITDPIYGCDGVESRGLLAYHETGMGKTREIVGCAVASKMLDPTRNIVIMMPNSLKNNARSEINNFYDNYAPDIYGETVALAPTFVTMDAHNSSKQMPPLDNSVLLVDEAHNFFRQIINGSKNARAIYENIMTAKNLRILFFTGTPCSKNPFELVPCMNMLAGYDLFPTHYYIFNKEFVSRRDLIDDVASTKIGENYRPKIKNRDKFMNRILGMVSHVSPHLPLALGDGENEPIALNIRDDGWYPEELPTKFMNVEMSALQYQLYLAARYKELDETKKLGQNGERRISSLTLPSSERSDGGTYFVRSRTTSNFAFDGETSIENMPNSAFDEDHSKKMWVITRTIIDSPGKGIVYSQFIKYGLDVLQRYLHNEGITEYKLNGQNNNNKMAAAADDDGGILGGLSEKPPKFQNVQARTAMRSDRTYFTPQYHMHGKIKYEPIVGCSNVDIFEDYTDAEKALIKQYVAPETMREFYDVYDENFPIPKEIRYRATNNQRRRTLEIELNLHHGQRKLLLSVIKFFNRLLPDDNEKYICVYAGSAPGHNIVWICDLYPQLEFYLYDPAEFDKKLHTHPRCHVFNQFFTDETAQEWKERGDCDLFISDIRLSQGNSEEFEKQVQEDNRRQDRWIQIIQPKIGSMVKYRPPYMYNTFHYEYILPLEEARKIILDGRPEEDNDIDIIDNLDLSKQKHVNDVVDEHEGDPIYGYILYDREHKYTILRQFATQNIIPRMDGIIEMQVWPPKFSAECRLISMPPYDMIEFDSKHYDNFFYLHNIISRNWLTFKQINDTVGYVPGFDRCYDCTNESRTWDIYLSRKTCSKHYRGKNVGHIMNDVTKHINQRLNMPQHKSFHGIFPERERCKCRRDIYELTTLTQGMPKKNESHEFMMAIDRKYKKITGGADIINSDSIFIDTKNSMKYVVDGDRKIIDDIAYYWIMPRIYIRSRMIGVIDFLTRYAFENMEKYRVLYIENDVHLTYENGFVCYHLSTLFPNIHFTVITKTQQHSDLITNTSNMYIIYDNNITDRVKLLAEIQKPYDFLICMKKLDPEWVDIINPLRGVMCTQRQMVREIKTPAEPRNPQAVMYKFKTFDYDNYQFAHILWTQGTWHYITKGYPYPVIEKNPKIIHEQQLIHDHNLPFVQYKNNSTIPIQGFDHCFDCCMESEIWSKYINIYQMKSKNKGVDVISLIAKLMLILSRILQPMTGVDEIYTDEALHGNCGASYEELKKKMLSLKKKYGGNDDEVAILRLYKIDEAQIDALARIASMPEVMANIANGELWDAAKVLDLTVYDKEDHDKDIAARQQYIITHGTTVAGYIGTRPVPGYARACQIRVFIDPDLQGKGIAKAALKLLIAQLPEKINEVWSQVKPSNIASAKLALSCGFILDGNGTFPGHVKYVYKHTATPPQQHVAAPSAHHAPSVPFPLRRYYMPIPQDMYKNLSKVRADDGTSLDSAPILFERTFPEEFDNTDSIADHWSGDERKNCQEKGKPKPAEVWASMASRYKHIKSWLQNPDKCKEAYENVYRKTRGCNLFNAGLATLIYSYVQKSFGTSEINILDPASGWGDRMIAAANVGAKTYLGYDTNPNLQKSYASISDFCHMMGSPTDMKVICEPFELAASQLQSIYHCILVSPPFFDQELYNGEQTSTNLYNSRQIWTEKYFIPMLEHGSAALIPGGYFFCYLPPYLYDECVSVLRGLERLNDIDFVQVVAGSTGKPRKTLVFRKLAAQSVPIIGAAEESDIEDPISDNHYFYYAQPQIAVGGGDSNTSRYAVISGEVSPEDRAAILSVYNGPENINGEIIKVLLVSKTGTEGLDCKCGRWSIMVEPFFDLARAEQFKARIIRMGSHDMLPKESRDVQPYIFLSDHNKKLWSEMPDIAREELTIDQMLLQRSEINYGLNSQFREMLRSACFECQLYGYGNCHTCQPTNEILYHKDFFLDMRLENPCKTITAEKRSVNMIKVDGVEYAWRKNEQMDTYEFFVKSAQLGKWVELDGADPKVEILKANINV